MDAINQWFVLIDGTEYGPYTTSQMRRLVLEKRIRPGSRVRRSGDETLYEIVGLADDQVNYSDIRCRPNVPIPVVPPLQVVSGSTTHLDGSIHRLIRSRKSSSFLLWSFGATVVAIFMLAFSASTLWAPWKPRATSSTLSVTEEKKDTDSKLPDFPGYDFKPKTEKKKDTDTRLPGVPGYDFTPEPGETLTVEVKRQAIGGAYYEAVFVTNKGQSRRYLIQTFANWKPFSIEVFIKGLPVETKAWWSNGNQSLSESTSWHKSELWGTWEFWNSNGETIGKVEIAESKITRLAVWDKVQMTAFARTNSFYNDHVQFVVFISREQLGYPLLRNR